jgi:hypothetical protein
MIFLVVIRLKICKIRNLLDLTGQLLARITSYVSKVKLLYRCVRTDEMTLAIGYSLSRRSQGIFGELTIGQDLSARFSCLIFISIAH